MKRFRPAPVMLVLLAGLSSLAASRAAAQSASLSGVLGEVKSVTHDAIAIQTTSGVVTLGLTPPVTTYRQVPSDLSHVTSNSYVGVASETLPNGSQVAKQILVFPPELRGAAEGSVLQNPPVGASTPSRMTNGTVSRSAAAPAQSRMTNGVAQKGSGTTLVVRYPGGSQTVSIPANVPVTQVAAGSVTLEAGDTVYAATVTEANGKLATSKVFVIAGPAPK